jgi:Platelet-activating factor acetylhydrolase, isoform II
MRPLESLLLLTDLMAFLVVSLSWMRVQIWARYLPALTAMVAAAQIFMEGSRWQMLPAYAVAVLFTLAWLRQNFTAAGERGVSKQPHHTISTVARVASALLLTIGAALPMALPVFRFPHPTGPHAIGTVTYHWIDTSRAEAFGSDSGQRRQLMAQIWYPALANSSEHHAAYMPDANVVTAAFAHVQHRPAFLFEQLRYVSTNAMLSVPVALNQARWPVLIFLEGATGFRQMNTFQVEYLVSNGYIVVAIDQPGAAATVVFPDGHQAVGLTVPQFHATVRPSYMPVAMDSMHAGLLLPNGSRLRDNSIIPYLAQDVSFTLDQLASLDIVDAHGILNGKLDLQRVGAFGVSLGGIVVGDACRRDARLRACLVMDAPMSTAVVAAGLRQPTMWITRDVASMRLEREQAGGWPEPEIEAHQRTMRAVYDGLRGDGYFVRVPGMFHSNFTDIPNWTPLARQFAIVGPINAEKAHDTVNAYSLAFFNRHLLGRMSSLLDVREKRSSDVLFESRWP